MTVAAHAAPARSTRYRLVQARADRVLVRYSQYLVARSRTDHAGVWIKDGQVTVLLLDTNLLPEDRATRLVPAVLAQVEEWLDAGTDLLTLFSAGRSFVTSWLDDSDVPPRKRFINAGLLRVNGVDVTFVGAYAPLYLCQPGAVERIVFDGTVWGVAGIDAYPARVGHLRLADNQRVYILSDGMLESRTPTGHINGDLLVSAYWKQADRIPEEDTVEELCARYRAADSEGLDSHGLLAIEPLSETGGAGDAR
jgi:hypothetical protein